MRSDFSVNEQCAYYRECELLTPFVKAGKPVFQIDEVARKLGFSAIRKRMSLSEWRQVC